MTTTNFDFPGPKVNLTHPGGWPKTIPKTFIPRHTYAEYCEAGKPLGKTGYPQWLHERYSEDVAVVTKERNDWREAAASVAVKLADITVERDDANSALAELEDKLQDPLADENGTVWTRPTTWAYMQVCKARNKHQANCEEFTARDKEDCSRALKALAGVGFVTPAETYGSDISWAISDLIRAAKEALVEGKGALDRIARAVYPHKKHSGYTYSVDFMIDEIARLYKQRDVNKEDLDRVARAAFQVEHERFAYPVDAVVATISTLHENQKTQAEVIQELQRKPLDNPERWESGFRSIVTIMIGDHTQFDINNVVELVRKLKDAAASLGYGKKAFPDLANCHNCGEFRGHGHECDPAVLNFIAEGGPAH